MRGQSGLFQFGNRVFDRRQLEETLQQEISRLERQLDHAATQEDENSLPIIKTYREMIARRKALLAGVRIKEIPVTS